MKTTVFVFHPHLTDGSKVNKALADAAKNENIEVRDMYQLYPDFKIDVEREKQVLTATDRIVLQFPIYWYQTPALLKQWFDDVLEHGWAYGSTGKALQGKEVLLAASFGAKASDYTPDGRFHVTTDEILKPITVIQYYTGMKFLPPFVTKGTFYMDDAELENQAKKYAATLVK